MDSGVLKRYKAKFYVLTQYQQSQLSFLLSFSMNKEND